MYWYNNSSNMPCMNATTTVSTNYSAPQEPPKTMCFQATPPPPPKPMCFQVAPPPPPPPKTMCFQAPPPPQPKPMCFKQNPTPPPKTVCTTYTSPPSNWFTAMSPDESAKYVSNMQNPSFRQDAPIFTPGQNPPTPAPAPTPTPTPGQNPPGQIPPAPTPPPLPSTYKLTDTIFSYEMMLLILALLAVIYFLTMYK